MVNEMPAHHRRFLLSFKRGEPDWPLLDLPDVPELPAVRWRMENLAQLSKEKRTRLITRLGEVLGSGVEGTAQ